jgi:hypothetical protein
MKSFSQWMAVGLVAAGIALVGCSSATTDTSATPADTTDHGPAAPALMLQDFEGAVSSDWILDSGYQNSVATASYPALATEALPASGYRTFGFLNGSHGATAWHPTGFAGGKALKFTLKSVLPTGANGADSHVVLNLTNQSLGTLGTYQGLTFLIKVPKADANDFIQNIGFSVLIRQRTAATASVTANDNTAVYIANVSSGTMNDDGLTIGNQSGSDSDWTYFGDGAVFAIKVPFDYFRVPGWWSANSEPGKATSIATALTAGAVFNSVDFDFRFNKPGSTYTENHDYTAYLDSVGLY